MNNIRMAFGLLLVVMTGLWLLAESLWPQPLTYFSFRTVFVQYSGVIAVAMMSVAMVLAVRHLWLEQPLGGLDKMYRLHKWLGVTALMVATLHWWWAKGTKWIVGWGWLVRPERGRGQGAGPQPSDLEQWLRTQRGLAESIGEWTFYAVVILLAIALVQRIPYRVFRKTHTWLALGYLLLAYHTLVLTKFDYWAQPIGWVLLLLIVAGCVSALLVLLRRVGAGRKVKGVIEHLQTYPGVKVIEGVIRLEQGWPGHRPGQFAFVTTSKHEGAHPYTIASAWQAESATLTFIVKRLGDWTGQLEQWLHVGMPVTVEGPYGCFDFTGQQSRQIWIGAGIGITPFVARMKYRQTHPDPTPVDLFHCTADVDQAALEKLTADANAAGVNLHLVITPHDGRLTAEQIRAAVPHWREASVWFCGPAAFGDNLRRDFVRQGLPAKAFHQELFQMR
ncbi:MAG: ferric reductase-like transmembrane domain-containing protein [Gammaproteobacteria bacterium]